MKTLDNTIDQKLLLEIITEIREAFDGLQSSYNVYARKQYLTVEEKEIKEELFRMCERMEEELYSLESKVIVDNDYTNDDDINYNHSKLRIVFGYIFGTVLNVLAVCIYALCLAFSRVVVVFIISIPFILIGFHISQFFPHWNEYQVAFTALGIGGALFMVARIFDEM